MSLSHQVDAALVRVSARLAGKVRDAIKASVDVPDVVNDFVRDFAGTVPTTGQARDWARMHVKIDSRRLGLVMDEVHAVGYVLGTDYAHAAYAQARRNKAVAPDPSTMQSSFDWSNWKPGDRDAAALVRPPGGLARLIDRRPELLEGLDTTTLDRIGTRLADGLAQGLADTQIQPLIGEVLGDPQRGLAIATTEMNVALSVATMDNYTELGVELVEWFALEGCEDCEGNADQGPIPLGDEFGSGDTEPPAHVNCRCSLLPVVPDDTGVMSGGENVPEMPEGVEAHDTAGDVTQPETPDFSPDNLDKPEPQQSFDYFDENKMTDYFPKDESGQISWGQMLGSDTDTVLAQQLADQGFNALPHLVDENQLAQLIDSGWSPVYRGVAGDTSEQVTQFVNDFKTSETPFIGKGMFGNGTYFASEFETAENFANVDRLGNAKSTGQVISGALHPDAKIIDYADLMRNVISSSEVKDVWGWGEVDDYVSNIATAKGYDAIRIVNPVVNWKGDTVDSTYWVILNRGSLAVTL